MAVLFHEFYIVLRYALVRNIGEYAESRCYWDAIFLVLPSIHLPALVVFAEGIVLQSAHLVPFEVEKVSELLPYFEVLDVRK
jgi:hypothetical protein